jgi:predicted esterase/tetratricopeptide (TPR) repeat protein
MSRLGGGFSAAQVAILILTAGWMGPGDLAAAEVLLKDGRVLQGKLVPLDSLADQPKAPDAVGAIQRIVLLDDDLRRTFVPERQIQQTLADPGQLLEKFTVPQRTLRAGRTVRSVGPRIANPPHDKFDQFGRRIFSFQTLRGPVDVVQGITLITPQWTKVEGINYIWDMRIATSSIPRDTLDKILLRQINPKDIEHRKKIARFYLQSERYKDAREELEAILKAFPDSPDIEKQLAPSIRSLRQMEAQQALGELKARREAGQHGLVVKILQEFPSEGVAGEILQAVREMAQQYDKLQSQVREVLQQFDAELAKIKDTALRAQLEPIGKEIRAELTIDTLGRMAAFRQNLDAAELSPSQKLSLAVSGWLLGSDAAVGKLSVALSLYRVRGLVRQYLNEPIKLNRDRILGSMRSEEGAVPGLVAAMLAQMKPAVDLPPPVSPQQPGFYELQIPGLAEQPPVHYLVQLPPQYNPYRRYPAVVTLHGTGTTAAQQIDWWAGAWTKDGWRAGQASRHGYIVIAPQWTVEHQKQYGYSAREHAAVLGSLRDACRRLAIDTDRVFLSGHSIGGDAAWDIGLAHPDLWAGVIPIVAQSDRYCAHYWENAERLPFYVVCGELDGDKLVKNARDLDRYLQHGYNCTVVEYLGRGHEHFYEEILRIYDWMGRFRRDFFPREFSCSTMRRWDNYFWWVELDRLPPNSMVEPADWPPPRGTRPAQVKAKITQNNGLNVTAGAERVTVWLSPEMLNFEQRANIVVNTRRANAEDRFVQPDLETLLGDVRTRGDRQHPFWAKTPELPTGRIFTQR